jgi:hypothetical protein
MSIIIDYLSQQKSLLMPVMDEFTSEQVDKYGGLTSEYAQLLHHIQHYLLRGVNGTGPHCIAVVSIVWRQRFGKGATSCVGNGSDAPVFTDS